MSMLPHGAAAAGGGVTLHRFLGEPRVRPHPVAVFGWAMKRLEGPLYHDDRMQGAVYLGTGLVAAAVAGGVVRSTTAGTYLAVAGRSLADEARAIASHLSAGDLASARAALPVLVGRDTADLSAGEVARAVVESVAENAVDALVAPALWGAAGGATGALCHRAVTTLDSLGGPGAGRYEHCGWAAARADDVAAWVPAHVTAGLVALVRPAAASTVLRTVMRDAPGHPSPSAGVAEAAFAGALGLRLGGPSSYGGRFEERPRLGDGRPPAAADIESACRLLEDVGLALVGLLYMPLVVHTGRRMLR
ncbi:MAG: CobD/CbiB family cobalamin biosynthesis protein [Acidimicrobiales bacterium]